MAVQGLGSLDGVFVTRLADYFPQNHSPIVWRRMHIKVDPNRKQLALQAYSISRAFELYVNGQLLIQSGGVEPYVADTRSARLIVRIPAAQLRTGSLVIAIRARAPTTWWTSNLPGFSGGMLTLGDEIALENQNLLIMIAENSATFLENLLALGVGFVALALFIAQRQRMEYFWIFVLGVLNAGYLLLLFFSLRFLYYHRAPPFAYSHIPQLKPPASWHDDHLQRRIRCFCVIQDSDQDHFLASRDLKHLTLSFELEAGLDSSKAEGSATDLSGGATEHYGRFKAT